MFSSKLDESIRGSNTTHFCPIPSVSFNSPSGELTWTWALLLLRLRHCGCLMRSWGSSQSCLYRLNRSGWTLHSKTKKSQILCLVEPWSLRHWRGKWLWILKVECFSFDRERAEVKIEKSISLNSEVWETTLSTPILRN